MKIDLHLHTNASDGLLSPAELVKLAAARGLEVIAITDHDSVEGIESALEAARLYPPLRLIPGVEISTDVPRGEVHILGYFVDPQDPELKATLERFRSSRMRRAQRMVAKLAHLGIHISWQRVEEIAQGAAIGRPHLAQAMLEKGYISNPREAFAKYIGRNGPAYAEREKMTPRGAVSFLLRRGAAPVLAHPADIEDPDRLLPALLKAGLKGMEVYYDGYPLETVLSLEKLAEKYQLIALGGSDYHGEGMSAGSELGSVLVPQESWERLEALALEKKKAGS